VQTRRVQAGTARPFRYLSKSVGGRKRITDVAAGEMPAFRAAVKARRRAAVLFERIRQYPPSTFVRRQAIDQKAELETCEAIREDLHLLGMKYGQIDP